MFRGGLRTVIAALVVFAALASFVPRASAAPVSAPPQAYILVDADTGRVLASSNDHEALPPASTAKLMTALTAVERLPSNAPVNVSPVAAAAPPSKITMLAGQKWSLEDSLASLMMVSANDAAYALAENTSGSLDAFAHAEASAAKRYGLRDSTFADPAGLDDASSFHGGPRMSAYDLAITARNTLAVPELALFAAMRERTFVDPAGNGRRLVNHNKMLVGGGRDYAGTNGMKTGFTNRSGHTLVATATRNGRTLIAVVLNTWDVYGWAAQYFDLGFSMPPRAKGTGERIPSVRVSPYSQRVADRAGFLALTTAAAATGPQTLAAATTTSTTPAERAAVVGSTVAPATVPALGGSHDSTGSASGSGAASGISASGATTANKGTKGSSGWLRNVGIVLLVLVIAFVLLRRRAVRRQRKRRIAQRRAVANAMRRGSLQVVDGRYRTGTRIGPPVESHVRVHREGRSPRGKAG
ncbi:MAG: D-alanyl-D-alanine carboxypeptidase [Actinomycetia bacterium]|nr:D-alanyl-D-alanine carboxypeptidase [Actinomycetes bacterium]